MNDELSAEIAKVREQLLEQLNQAQNKRDILRSSVLRSLYSRISTLEPQQKAEFGQAVNALKSEIEQLIQADLNKTQELPPIDITAPFGPNKVSERFGILTAESGSIHPLMYEQNLICEIFSDMGFSAMESREIDDDWHMFTSLNFPEGHPARDDYDTFNLVQSDKQGRPLLAPAHTSTMQNRALKDHQDELKHGRPIAVILPGRVFRHEDVDARHEHTFYQFEGIYVDEGVTIGNLVATLVAFLESYYQQKVTFRTQPFYFPFTEPSLEFSIGCPFCDQQGCHVCSGSGWIELIGCGMIHPNVLRAAAIDPDKYQGFAWGCGIDRLVMMKYGIEDVRWFESGRLEFLRQFSPGGNL
ncbi:phenylalanine--tRNA ligase subunit alpha [Patescibacteria group bacterium]|nr:phenylalanine--tRNA ligase subunit alpha [Patescibacteria group bacterium]